jgi:hypothetical protein
MNKTITQAAIFLALAFLTCCKEKQQEKPIPGNVFTSVDYDKVIAYSYEGRPMEQIINKDGRLSQSIKKQAELNKVQTTRLTNIFCKESTYGDDRAACFDPHFGVVFYKENKPKAYVSVCLDCNYLISSVAIPGSKSGFSDDGFKNIYDFIEELGFQTLPDK